MIIFLLGSMCTLRKSIIELYRVQTVKHHAFIRSKNNI